MLSLHVARQGSALKLMLRDYSCQGPRPDYTMLCSLSEAEAAALIESTLVEPWFDVEITNRGDIKPSDLMFLIPGETGFEVILKLPEAAWRSKEIEVPVPIPDSLRFKIRRDAEARAEFIRETLITDGQPSGVGGDSQSGTVEEATHFDAEQDISLELIQSIMFALGTDVPVPNRLVFRALRWCSRELDRKAA